jgi:hypothetical protein
MLSLFLHFDYHCILYWEVYLNYSWKFRHSKSFLTRSNDVLTNFADKLFKITHDLVPVEEYIRNKVVVYLDPLKASSRVAFNIKYNSNCQLNNAWNECKKLHMHWYIIESVFCNLNVLHYFLHYIFKLCNNFWKVVHCKVIQCKCVTIWRSCYWYCDSVILLHLSYLFLYVTT